eukprot:GHVS01028106.1.p1 GENE.GHVS01028106.1~~GHVS01028106.1.p1  ORF type:complete len:317 (+),score=44.99 GHVS01028106.1:135-1085(+)
MVQHVSVLRLWSSLGCCCGYKYMFPKSLQTYNTSYSSSFPRRHISSYLNSPRYVHNNRHDVVGSSWSPPTSSIVGAIRGYTHWKRSFPEDYELPQDTIPKNMKEVLEKKPENMDFLENYWYWKVRSESTLLDTENLASKSYRQLARDMGMPIVTEHTEHYIGLLELYEYLKSAPFVGPFGTLENPVIVPSVYNERFVACTGGTGDSEHHALWFRCREGFLYRCGECDQIFMLVRALADFEDSDPHKTPPEDQDMLDVFDKSVISKGMKTYNSGDYIKWPLGDAVYNQMFREGGWGNAVPVLTPEKPQVEPMKEHQS